MDLKFVLESLVKVDGEDFSDFRFRLQHLELDVTDSPAEKAWDSFFVCILQNVLQQYACIEIKDLLLHTGASWARLEVMMERINRKFARVTCEDICTAITDGCPEITSALQDFYALVNQLLGRSTHLQFFNWQTCFLFVCSNETDANSTEIILVHDPELNCFRTICNRKLLFTKMDHYFESLFTQIVEKQEMLPYFVNVFESLDALEFRPWMERSFPKLQSVLTIPQFPATLLENYEQTVPQSNFTLLTKYDGAVKGKTKEEILFAMKRQYVLTVDEATKSVLEGRVREHRDRALATIEKEERLAIENCRLEEEFREAEEQRRQRELELEQYRLDLENSEADKEKFEELIKQKECELSKTLKEIVQRREYLAWINFKKHLMAKELSYQTMKQVSQVLSIKSSPTLIELCERIIKHISLPFFDSATEKDDLDSYVKKNEDANKGREIDEILSFLFEPPKIAPNSDRQEILEVTGRQIILSEILGNVLKYRNFTELRVVGGLSVYLDTDLKQESFNGINIVVSAPTIEVIGNVTIDTSGNPGKPQTKLGKAKDGAHEGYNGSDGSDGEAGQSAGHIFFQTSNWIGSEGLNLIAIGGNGGHGQDGGDGKDGVNGYNGVDGDVEKNWSKQSDGNGYIHKGTGGKAGGKGGNGGNAGLGGEGGNRGIIQTGDGFGGHATSEDGSQGQDGKRGAGGFGGRGGTDGVDDGCAWHNYKFAGGEWRYAKGKLDMENQGVWYGGNGRKLIVRKSEDDTRNSRAANGHHGNDGKDCATRENQRKTTTTQRKISQKEVSSLSQSVRNIYTHSNTSSISNEVASLQAQKQSLEEQKGTLESEKLSAETSKTELEEHIEDTKINIEKTEEDKATLQQQMAANLLKQESVRQELEKVAAEKILLANSISVVQTAESVAVSISQVIQNQLQQQNQMQKGQELQATITTEFDPLNYNLLEKDAVTIEEIHSDKASILAKYGNIEDLTILPDEVFPVVLAAKVEDTELAHAFEIGLQSVASEQKLPQSVKKFLVEKLAIIKENPKQISPIYLKKYFPEDMRIVGQTQIWAYKYRGDAEAIFGLGSYKGNSVGEYLLRIRNQVELRIPKKNSAFQGKIDRLLSKYPVGESSLPGRLLLEHLSTVMINCMESWFLEECEKLKFPREITTKIQALVDRVDDIYLEVRPVVPGLSLQEAYTLFLSIAKSTAFLDMSHKEIWQEFVLLVTKLKGSKTSGFKDLKRNLEEIQNLVAGKLGRSVTKITNALKVLSFAVEYVQMTPEELKMLYYFCVKSSCYLYKQHGEPFKAFQNVQTALKDNFFKNHVQPMMQGIESLVKKTFEGKIERRYLQALAEIVSFLGKFQDVVSFDEQIAHLQNYSNMVKDIRKVLDNDPTNELSKFMSNLEERVVQQVASIGKISLDSGKHSAIRVVTSSIYEAHRKIMHISKCFLTQSNKPSDIEDMMGLAFLLRGTTHLVGLHSEQLKGEDMYALNKALLHLLTDTSVYKLNCLLAEELHRFQSHLKKLWKQLLHNCIIGKIEQQKKTYDGLDDSISAVVDLVKSIIETSSEVLHQSEILVCLRMHLIKIVDGLEAKGTSSIANVLQGILTDLSDSTKGKKPVDFLKHVAELINFQSSVAFQIKDIPFDPCNISDMVAFSSNLLQELKTAEDFDQIQKSLENILHATSYSQKMDLSIFDVGDAGRKNISPVESSRRFHHLVQEVLADNLNHLPDKIMDIVQKLDAFVTALEVGDPGSFFDTIQSSRDQRELLLDDKVQMLLERSAADIEDIFDVYENGGEQVISYGGPIEFYCQQVTNLLGKNFEGSSKQQCGTALDSIYLESVLKYFSLRSIPTLPSALRAAILRLKSSTTGTDFTNIFDAFLAQVPADTADQLHGWEIPFLIAYQKLISILPESLAASEGIFSMLQKIQACRMATCNEEINGIFRSISRDMTTLSFRVVSSKLHDSELLEKANRCICLITHGCSPLRKDLLQCKLYASFEQFIASPETDQHSFFNQTIIPFIEEEVGVTLKRKIRSVDVRQQLMFIINDIGEDFTGEGSVILGLLLVKCNLNRLETEFYKTLMEEDDCAPWEPTTAQKDKLLDFVRAIGLEIPSDELFEEENRLLKIFLADVAIEGKTLKIPFITPEAQCYLQILLSVVTPDKHNETLDKIKEVLVKELPGDWALSIKELVKDSVFIRFLDLYFPHDLESKLGAADAEIYKNMKMELESFRKSHFEDEAGNEKLEKCCRLYDNHAEPGVFLLEDKVKQMIQFKHFFNRYFFFNKEKDEKSIFAWLEILYQRCRLRPIPFYDFNDLFTRFNELPSDELRLIVSQSVLDEWMETILVQIALKNYKALQAKVQDGNGEHLHDDTFSFEVCLEKWRPSGSAKNKLLGILADTLLEEVDYPSHSTTVDLRTIRAGLKAVEILNITPALVNDLNESPLSSWARKTRQHELLERFSPESTDCILKFEEKFGTDISTRMLAILKDVSDELIHPFIDKFNCSKWELDTVLLAKMEGCKELSALNEICTDYTKKLTETKRDVKEIARLMREDTKNGDFLSDVGLFPTSKSEDSPLMEKCRLEEDIGKVKNFLSRRSKVATDLDTSIEKWDLSTLKTWVSRFPKDTDSRRAVVQKNLHEILAVINQGVFIWKKFRPHDTQLASSWLLIQRSFSQKGCLAEIQTGEGKTIIVAMMVVVRVLSGDNVDVITSSPVLAEENLTDVREFFEMFNIAAATNCDAGAEKEEKVRKERYNNKVIYGDVGSFQRDILLTEFFDKGITMGRVPDIVFVDEVDSMLLDKGENILYLSHNIPDLRFLWPIFVEIWNAVHAPDVCQGRNEDVFAVARFVKERMRQGEIFFPNSLQTFIQERLVVWIQNAFLAMHMNENDPYILADVNNKGPTVVIMDKDTGVEQVSMNWSNGLHQFIQLKHTDRLSSESLKAVFMSNICYFRKFQGRLFGITGTLGSISERELLSKCYGVEFFAIPRFKARRCVEDEGYVFAEYGAWMDQIKSVVGLQCTRGRATLIICENVEAVDKICETLRPMYNTKVYSYKSTLDEEFKKRRATGPLVEGDIVVATNIAGRGTDLKTSKDVEVAGGLHVVLSFMPTNVRVEEQAFGRTSRNGKKGSVQYIVLHEGATTEITVHSLRRIRDEHESKRLDSFRIKSIPRIEVEEKLCERFKDLLKYIKEKLSGCPTDIQNLHIDNLKNKWAMWLDSMSEKIKLTHITNETPILEAYEKFEEELQSNVNSSEKKFESGPIELINLGRAFEKKGDPKEAQSYFERAIKMEPNFSEAAHYYNAAVILGQDSSGLGGKRQAIHHLKAADKLLKKRINLLMSSSQTLRITDDFRRQSGKGTMSNRYDKQIANECELYQIHCGKIDEAVGASITDRTFLGAKISDEKEAEAIFDILRKNDEVLKNFRLSKKIHFDFNDDLVVSNNICSWPGAFLYCKKEVVANLKQRLTDGSLRSRILDVDAFRHLVWSQPKIWNILSQNSFIINIRRDHTLIVVSSKEKFLNVSLREDLEDYRNSIETILERNDKAVYNARIFDDLFLPPEQYPVLESALSASGNLVSGSTLEADVNPEVLQQLQYNPGKKSWEGFPPALKEYQDLLEVTIEEDPTEDSPEPNQKPLLKSKIRLDDIPLPADATTASHQLWAFLRQAGAIKDVRVNFPLDNARSQSTVDEYRSRIKRSLENDAALGTTLDEFHPDPKLKPSIDDVMEVVERNVGKIKTIPSIETSYSPLRDYYKSGQEPPELEDVKNMSYESALDLTEKKSWWDWGAFIVAMLGVLQVVGGALLTVFTFGVAFHFGMALIGEGVGDIAFAIEAGLNKNFSWKDYGIHKAISVVISIATAGVGIWLSKGVQLAKYAGKAAFVLLKMAGKTMLKKIIAVVAFTLASFGIDKLLDFIRLTILNNCKTSLSSIMKKDLVVKSSFEELDKVMDEVRSHSSEDGQAERVIEDAFASVSKDVQSSGVGAEIEKYANKVISCVTSAMGKTGSHLGKVGTQVLEGLSVGSAASQNSWGKVIQISLKMIEYATKAASFIKSLCDMIMYGQQVLTKLVQNLKYQLVNLKKRNVDASRSAVVRSESENFGKFKNEFSDKVSMDIVTFLSSTVQSSMVKPAFEYCAQKLMVYTTKKVKSAAKYFYQPKSDPNSSPLQRLRESNQLLTWVKKKVGVKGKVDVNQLDPNTKLKGSNISISEAKARYGDMVVFYKDNKGNVFCEKPTYGQMVKKLGKGKNPGTLELSICANHFDCNLSIEDPTGEFRFNDGKVDIQTNFNSKNKKTMELVCYRDENGNMKFKPKVKGDAVDLLAGNDSESTGLYQSLRFLSKVQKANKDLSSDEFNSIMIESWNPAKVAKQISKIKRNAKWVSPVTKEFYDSDQYHDKRNMIEQKKGDQLTVRISGSSLLEKLQRSQSVDATMTTEYWGRFDSMHADMPLRRARTNINARRSVMPSSPM